MSERRWPASEDDAEAVRGAVRMIMAAVGPAADRYGWLAVFSALPTILVPLLCTVGTIEEAQFALRGIAEQAPAIAASWAERYGPLGPPAGQA
jgi:hypothetical protein